MEEQPPLRQAWLLDYINPLREKFGPSFFASLPTHAGVYLMRGQLGAVLYVGKAKNLKARISSYRQAKPDQSSRRILRMLRLVERIEWQACEDEQAALLRENALIREYRPPFNIVNASPESYTFIGVSRRATRVRLRLTTLEESVQPGERLHGVFKGRGMTRDAYAALLRLLWAVTVRQERYFPPQQLNRPVPPESYEFDFNCSSKELRLWRHALDSYLQGRSRHLLARLTQGLLANTTLPPFLFHSIEQDLMTLAEFYSYGPRRLYRLRRFHGLGQRLIRQEEIDDLWVIFRYTSQRDGQGRTQTL